MMTRRSTILAAALAVAALPALAQGGPGPGNGWGPMMGGGPGYGMMGGGYGGGWGMMGGRPMMPMTGWMAQSRFRDTDARLAYIKTELKITAAQEAKWDAFAKAVAANAKTMIERRRTMMSALDTAKTLPERLAVEQQAMAAHVDAITSMQGALSDLYGALSPEQKKLADDMVVGPMGMPMGFGMM